MSRLELCSQCGRRAILVAFTDPGFRWYCAACDAKVIVGDDQELEVEPRYGGNFPPGNYNVWGLERTEEEKADEEGIQPSS